MNRNNLWLLCTGRIFIVLYTHVVPLVDLSSSSLTVCFLGVFPSSRTENPTLSKWISLIPFTSTGTRVTVVKTKSKFCLKGPPRLSTQGF